jgi:hypothetical protein
MYQLKKTLLENDGRLNFIDPVNNLKRNMKATAKQMVTAVETTIDQAQCDGVCT